MKTDSVGTVGHHWADGVTPAAARVHLQSGRKIEALGQGEKPEAPGMSRVMDAFA
jgi:hypothetical protein